MSVVNKMLQDLEQRQQQAQPAGSDYQPSRPSLLRRYRLGLLAVLLIGVGVWALMGRSDPTESSVMSSTGDSQQQTPVTAQQQPQPESPTPAKQVTETEPPPDRSESQEPAREAESQPVVVGGQQESQAVEPEEPEKVQPQPEPQEATTSTPKPTRTQPESSASVAESESPEPSKPEVLKRQVKISEAEQVRRKLEPLLTKRRYAQAIPLLARLLKLEPEAHSIRAKLVNLSLQQGRTALAVSTLQQAVEQFPEHYEYRWRLARLWRQERPQQALSLLMAQQPPLASYTDYYALRAGLAREQEQFLQAVKDYYRLLELQPQNDRWRLGMAIALDKAGQHQPALQQYRRVSASMELPEQARRFIQQRIGALGGK